MNLLFITQSYSSTRVEIFEELVYFLSRSGWSVTVVSPACPGDSNVSRASDGIRVIEVPKLFSKASGIPIRAIQYAAESMARTVSAMFVESPDVVLVYGPPLVGPVLGWAVARRHGAALVNLLYDIYPDIAEKTGHITSPLVLSWARSWERFQYKVADKTIVLSEGFRSMLLKRGVHPDCVDVVPVWFDSAKVEPQKENADWRKRRGIAEDAVVVMFSGTLGLVSNAVVIADAADCLRHRKDIVFVVVGEGGLRRPLEERAAKLNLDNIVFLPFQHRRELAYQLGAADICLVTMGSGLGYTSFPSKMLAYMAAGRPVVGSLDKDCAAAQEIEQGEFGLVVPPPSAVALAGGVEKLADDPNARLKMGKAARRVLQERFDAKIALKKFEAVLRGARDL